MNSHHFNQEPFLEVGIVSGLELHITFKQPFCLQQTGNSPETTDCQFEGDFTLTYQNGHIHFQGKTYDQLRFVPVRPGSAFELHDVRIGIGFHWERTERQVFEGEIHFIVTNETITAINRVLLESYLTSVISSEMSANASMELLKAHAVISRSWLLSQVLQKGKKKTALSSMLETETERVKWYDREDHDLFDVCADDHCQRYQGKTKAGNPNVRLAIHHTRGQVLRSGDEVCDARFSKSCGGHLEEFQYCWENTPRPYLKGKPDRSLAGDNPKEHETTINGNPETLPDLRQEQAARTWILGNPSSFCNTHDPVILSQVLNNYDQETPDFYRWHVRYEQQEISELFARRTGMDVGEILDLEPLERGVSGRIVRLKVTGSKKTVVIGKELEIRKALSNTHLYSSAFVVEKTATGFTLHGAGWGHGVGLCQIGAAVMGEQGYSYQDILAHYYPSTILDSLYP